MKQKQKQSTTHEKILRKMEITKVDESTTKTRENEREAKKIAE